ncbi:MAG TPA: hypothetical protein VM163_07410 [bacterium]|nr:hypothetical protein [bacterium]
MVKEVRVYVEGGGDRRNDRRNLKRGFSQFLNDIRQNARLREIRWSVVASGNRSQTYRAFGHARQQHPDAFNVLLVDSEGPVQPNTPSWKYLHDREYDKWELSAQYEPNCH